MKRTITRIFPFDAGHRIVGHESKCANLHGHGYLAYVTVKSEELDDLGRVIDFGVIKNLIGKWIDDNWDHNMILFHEDPLLNIKIEPKDAHDLFQAGLWGKKSPYVMSRNPTAENMAEELFMTAEELLGQHDIEVVNVRIYETQKCYADFSRH